MMPYGMTNDTLQANPCGVFFLQKSGKGMRLRV